MLQSRKKARKEAEGTTLLDLPTTGNVGKLKLWLHHNHVNSLDSIELKPSTRCYNSLGCFANKCYTVGDIIFRIPRRAIYGLYQAEKRPIVAAIRKFAKCSNKYNYTSDLLVWVGMIQSMQSEEEPFFGYFNSLDDKVSPSLLSWDSTLLSIVDSTNLHFAIDDLKSQIRGYFDFLMLVKEDSNGDESVFPWSRLTIESLTWACG